MQGSALPTCFIKIRRHCRQMYPKDKKKSQAALRAAAVAERKAAELARAARAQFLQDAAKDFEAIKLTRQRFVLKVAEAQCLARAEGQHTSPRGAHACCANDRMAQALENHSRLRAHACTHTQGGR